jgi:hypothetical protein
MNPIDPNGIPEEMNPNDPGAQPKSQPTGDSGSTSTDGNAAGGIIAVEGASELVGGVADAAGSVLEGASVCADRCGSCSIAIVIALFVTAQAAFAIFR